MGNPLWEERYIYKLSCFDGGSEGPVMPTIKKASNQSYRSLRLCCPRLQEPGLWWCAPAALLWEASPWQLHHRASCCINIQLESQPHSLGCLL